VSPPTCAWPPPCLDDPLDPLHHRRDVDVDVADMDAALGRAPRLVGDLGTPDERLRGNAAANRAGAPDAVPLDDRDAPGGGGGPVHGVQPGHTGAADHEIKPGTHLDLQAASGAGGPATAGGGVGGRVCMGLPHRAARDARHAAQPGMVAVAQDGDSITLRSIQAVFSCTWSRWVSRSAVDWSLAAAAVANTPRAVRATCSWPTNS